MAAPTTPTPSSSSASTARRRRTSRSRVQSSASARRASSISCTPGRCPRPGAAAAPTSRTSTARWKPRTPCSSPPRRAHPGLAEVEWEGELIGGPPARSIADVAKVRGADEIVIGTRGFGRVRALLGSVAHELIHLADCPVTVIPERLVEREGRTAAEEPAGAAA